MTEERPLGPLEQQALKRKERLNSLKRKISERNESSAPTNPFESLPTPKFRSYKPKDENLTEFAKKTAEIVDVESSVKDLLELSKNGTVIEQLDISSLAPRQPDWDLKRDVAKKLEKLERRTQRAMAELIREKLKEKQDLAELADQPTPTY